jgi:hypothetical protein
MLDVAPTNARSETIGILDRIAIWGRGIGPKLATSPGRVGSWARGMALTAIVLLLVAIMWPGADPAPRLLDGDKGAVAAAWNEAVSLLNIEPIYPPQEDVYVGDIYAVVTRADRGFLGRSIKLWHVDLSDQIKDAYLNVPMFPTLAPADNNQSAWEQGTSDDLFGNGQRKALPLVAFPGFKIRSSRQAEAALSSGSSLSHWFGGLFGFARDNDEIEELQFPRSETYGVNAVVASSALGLFCKDERSLPLCTENGARRMLSMVVGEGIWKPEIDPKSKTETGRYAMGVELMLINQVYLTRSIVHVHSANSNRGQTVQLIAKLKMLTEDDWIAPNASSAKSEPGSAGQANDSNAGTGNKQTENALVEAQRVRIQGIINELVQADPSLRAGAYSFDGRNITLNQSFPRPIAFGFRGVRMVPLTDGLEKK